MAALVCRRGTAESGTQGNGVRFVDHDRQRGRARIRRCVVAGGAVSGRGPSAAAGEALQDRSAARRLLDYVVALKATITGNALIQELVARNDRSKAESPGNRDEIQNLMEECGNSPSRTTGGECAITIRRGPEMPTASAPAPPGTGSIPAPH